MRRQSRPKTYEKTYALLKLPMKRLTLNQEDNLELVLFLPFLTAVLRMGLRGSKFGNVLLNMVFYRRRLYCLNIAAS